MTKYKQTGIKWMPEIPEHWEIFRLGNFFRERTEIVSDKEFKPLSVTMQGILPQLESIAKTDNGDNRKRVCIGDFVINSRSDRKGSGGVSKYEGSVSVISNVLKSNEKFDLNYTNYLFTNKLFQEEYYYRGKGIVADMWSTKYKEMRNILIPLPPLPEQKIIAEYLDKKIDKINHFISQKQKFIALLKEQRQSIINERLSEKGKKIKIKFCVTKVGAGVTPTGGATVYQESGVLFLRSQNVHNDGLRLNDVAYISKEINSEMKGSQVKYEDVLINITGASIGRCFVFDKREDANVNQHVCILRPKKDTILSEYLMLQLQSDRIQTLINMIEGASREGLTNNELKNYFIFVPSLKEQLSIISTIKSETQKIDHTISQAEKEIELIKEYKEAMIAEAVMGKVNIKEAKSPQSITTKKEANWEFKEAVLISVLTDKFGSEQYPLGRKRYTKYSYLFHRHTDNKTEGYLKKAAGPYNPKTKYGGPEKIALQNKYVSEVQNGNLSGFVASDKIEDARNYFGNYWNTESLNWLEQLRYKKNDELELYATVDKAMVELAESNKDINLQLVKQIIDEHPEWKPKLERDIFSDDNIVKAMEFLKTLFQ
ncbi:hypothetical protein CMT52_08400 [Elizabethkingia anophelis]|nr:hypothetical protein [Elizabethkingia anophelis]